jgi:hypothetical protein
LDDRQDVAAKFAHLPVVANLEVVWEEAAGLGLGVTSCAKHDPDAMIVATNKESRNSSLAANSNGKGRMSVSW